MPVRGAYEYFTPLCEEGGSIHAFQEACCRGDDFKRYC